MAKEEVIRFRVSKDDKANIKLASDMSGLSMSNIIINGALKEAKKILREIEKGNK